ncbi:hypothetical protein OFAG_02257 [Oxalobacter formigenes HOxBLS]|uniref:Restriction endonuclease n=2 Tax=Oxalobacter paraformigenes TaxID=556268 RepID=T5LE71_9BURK|nr:hypothetical protein OFAG_02257 [Oxalobacter paraformigenes]
MGTKTELLPFPFCGERARLYRITQYIYNAYCPRCDASFSGGSKEDMIKKWNTRTGDL